MGLDLCPGFSVSFVCPFPTRCSCAGRGGEMLPAEDVQEDVWSNQAACSGGMKHEKGLSPLGKPQGQHGQQAPG